MGVEAYFKIRTTVNCFSHFEQISKLPTGGFDEDEALLDHIDFESAV